MSNPARIEPGPNASLDSVVIRFAGDSGDGMQLIGNQFTRTSALAGNDLATLPEVATDQRVSFKFGAIDFVTTPEKRQYRWQLYEGERLFARDNEVRFCMTPSLIYRIKAR